MNEFPELGEINARLFLMESHDATVARAEMMIGGRLFEVNASAKKHPIDREDQRIGELYAMGRALERMGKKMQKLADGYVREADNVRHDKEQKRKGFPAIRRFVASQGWINDEDQFVFGSEPEDNPNQSVL